MQFDIAQSEREANRLLKNNGIKLSPLTSCIADKTRGRFSENTYTVGYGEMKISEINDGIAEWAKLWRNWIKK
jgi:hypothetical protein